ncbi:MAG: hypothetical protein H0T85_08295 [Geodermatophilaceae bacterium]|nr:hypothetical protein [Geodermatophilaceae bacterium]
MNESGRGSRRLLTVPATRLAAGRDGVLTRADLHGFGLTRWDLRREVAAGRWRLHGNHCILTHTGPLDRRARWRIALHEVQAHAALDGVTALHAAGLEHYAEDTIHVSIPRGARPRSWPGVHVHETRRRRDSDVLYQGIRRAHPAVAAVRGALWARSDRQAALILVMTAQQRLASGTDLAHALAPIKRDRRRRLLTAVVGDVVDGAQSLGELDFADLCRRYGIPPPSRQVIRTGPLGRAFLDAYWDDCDVVVEIEGIHHGDGLTQVEDALRQNTLSAGGAAWLRIPVLGLRIAPGAFMAQVAAARSRRHGS